MQRPLLDTGTDVAVATATHTIIDYTHSFQDKLIFMKNLRGRPAFLAANRATATSLSLLGTTMIAGSSVQAALNTSFLD